MIGKEGATISREATHAGTPLTSGNLGGARDSPDLVRALGHWGIETLERYLDGRQSLGKELQRRD